MTIINRIILLFAIITNAWIVTAASQTKFSPANHNLLCCAKTNPLLDDFMTQLRLKLKKGDVHLLEIGAGDRFSSLLFPVISYIKAQATPPKHILTLTINNLSLEHINDMRSHLLSLEGIKQTAAHSFILESQLIHVELKAGDIFDQFESISLVDLAYISNVTHFFNPMDFIRFFDMVHERLTPEACCCLIQRDIEAYALMPGATALYQDYQSNWKAGDIWAGYLIENIAPIHIRTILERQSHQDDPAILTRLIADFKKGTYHWTYNDISDDFIKQFFPVFGFEVKQIKGFSISHQGSKRLACLLKKTHSKDSLEKQMILKKAIDKTSLYQAVYDDCSRMDPSDFIAQMKPCSWCLKLNPHNSSCAKCQTTYYCNKSCQTRHWKKEHKQECKKEQAKALKERGNVLFKKGDYVQAILLYQKAFDCDPDPIYLSNLGFAHQRLEQYDEAIKVFDQALAMASLTAAIRKKCAHRKLTSLVSLKKIGEAQQLAAQLQEGGILTKSEISKILH